MATLMRFKGVGAYNHLKKDGDFAYRVDVIDGHEHWQLALWCPKYKVCLTRIHRAPADRASATWEWDGNIEKPTITPSIGCDDAPRCGRHSVISNGEQSR